MSLPTIERGTFLVIRCDGSEAVIRDTSIPAIKAAIGAQTLDFVTLSWQWDRPDLVMAVDDAGYVFEVIDKATGAVISQEEELARPGGHFEHRALQARKPVNRRATKLYWSVCKPGTTHEIVGDVAILHDGDFKEAT